jgi:HEAT repeat protein
MDSSAVARHFARLVWLLVYDAPNVDEQKSALRALVSAGKTQAATLTLGDWRVLADGRALPEDSAETQTLAAQMIGHSVTELRMNAAAAPGHVLALARALSGEPRPGSGGRAVAAALAGIESPTISAIVDTVPTPEPERPLDAAAKPTRPPMRASGSYLAFAAVPTPKSSIWEMLVELTGVSSAEHATQLLEGIVTLVNRAAEEGKGELVADTLCALVSGEDARTDPALKRAYTMAVRQLKKPRLIRMVAGLLATRPENTDQLLALLGRWGQDATDSLIEELTVAETLAERRVLFDALVTLKAGTPSLLHMLKDRRWFVLRNAAELLGELPTPEAEAPLARLLKHDDERVRRAAAVSLGKIATGNAFSALRAALRDESAEVRLVAATALGSWKRATASHSLVVALEDEADGDVQLQIIATLGRVATPDAVQRLIALTEPGGTLFKRKATAVRLAAVEALAEAATPAAIDALKALREDKDAAVRESAYRVVNATRPPPTQRAPE